LSGGEGCRGILDDALEGFGTRVLQPFLAGAFGLILLLSPLFFLSALLDSALLLFLVFLPLLFVVALTLLGLCFRFSFGRGCDGGGGIGDLCFRRSWVMDRALVVRAYGGRRAYTLAVDNDCGPGGGAWRGWLGIGVLDYLLDLAEVAALDGSGPLLL
jgi:hypothetical protein